MNLKNEQKINLKRTKIISTLGPVTESKSLIKQLYEAGVDIFRLNFSHGTLNEHEQRIADIRLVTNDQAAILIDLPGPKIRIGEIEDGTVLRQGNKFIITTRNIHGNKEEVSVSYNGLPQDVSPGQQICLADGLITLKVKEIINNTDIITEVIDGGSISSGKGLNVPNAPLKLFFPTKNDIEIIKYAINLEPDFFGLSFVRRTKDIQIIRDLLQEKNVHTALIAKIEHRDALTEFPDILSQSDAVMIARGDLGIEIPIEDIPVIQKELITQCRNANRPVIVATQVLLSMVHSPRPSRAEANDIANSILEGTDALMLSEETAIGDYPIESVKYMNRIAKRTEYYMSKTQGISPPKLLDTIDPIENSINSIANSPSDIAAILTGTRTGRTARIVSKYRPSQPILATTPSSRIFKQLKLVWGVIPLLISETESTDDFIYNSITQALESDLITVRDKILIVAGSLFGKRAKTNFIQVLQVEQALEAKSKLK